MVLHLATDHAGFEHKETVSLWLQAEGYTVVDQGAYTLNPEDDFTDYIALAAQAVSANPLETKAIIFGGSGQGEAMLANRYPGVRAAVFYGGEATIPVLSRQHNNSNVISIGARFVDINLTKKIIWDWLQAEPLSDEKYQRRNKKLDDIFKL